MIDAIEAIYNHGIRVQKHALWVFGAILVLMTTATAGTASGTGAPIALNEYGMTAPFLMSWAPIWVFAFMGGIGALFFKIEAIDQDFRVLFLAKPFLGLFGAMSLCLMLTDGSEPPNQILIAYAFLASLLSAPILQALLAVASLKQNQAELFNKINPFKFKVIVPGETEKGNKR